MNYDNSHVEIWDLYTKNRIKTGITHQRGKPIPNGSFHIVVEVWTIVDEREILLTQRHPNKAWPLLWECTGGSILKNETSIQGVKREIYEEIGLTIMENDLELVYEYTNNESIYDVYALYIEKSRLNEIKPGKDEVVDYKTVTRDEFNEMINKEEVIPKLGFLNDLIDNGKIRLTTAST